MLFLAYAPISIGLYLIFLTHVYYLVPTLYRLYIRSVVRELADASHIVLCC